MKNTCKSCDSTNIVEKLAIADNAYGAIYNLSINIETDPGAVLFRGIKSHNLLANVCIDCGSVELKIKNPKKFHTDYLKSKKKG